VRRLITVATLLFALPTPTRGDTIVLTNGHTIEVDRTWVQGSQLLYEKNGGTFGLPRTLVQRIDQKVGPEPTSDPDIQRARERLAHEDAAEAVRAVHQALVRDPNSVPALQTLALAYLHLGDGRSARDATDRALRIDDRNATTRALRGDALVSMGDRAGAEIEYRRSLQLRPDPEVQRKLGEPVTPALGPQRPAQFRVRYDGSVNEALGLAVVRILTEAYNDDARRLGATPEEPITVILQTEARFQDARTPLWAEGLNDGTIRVPAQGLDAASPRLTRILRHELAHSFIAARTAGNCPTWLQEGIAQWLEGGDPAREDSTLAPIARAGRLLPLLTLEAPFQSLSETDAVQAYAQSLSAVAHILRQSGEIGLVRLLSALGDRTPSEEALPVALALSYPELQKSWADALRVADGKTAAR
jgi:tetratricopeptide (TPR) repeat protein